GNILDAGIGNAIFEVATGIIMITFGSSRLFSEHLEFLSVTGFTIAGFGDLLPIMVKNIYELFIVHVVIGIAVGILYPVWDALYGDTWLIPKSNTMTPTNFLVEDGWSRTYLGAKRRHMKIPILSFELAKSLFSDYIRSCIAVLEGCEPGIFAVEGKVDDVKKYDKELSLAKVRQLRWFEELIRMADNDWAKSGHKHNVISNLQRDVARLLG